MPQYIPAELKDGQIYSMMTYYLGEVALFLEKYFSIHEYENILFYLVVFIIAFCCLTLIAGGIYIGSRYFQKTRTVYVLREMNQSEIPQDDEERNEDSFAESLNELEENDTN